MAVIANYYQNKEDDYVYDKVSGTKYIQLPKFNNTCCGYDWGGLYFNKAVIPQWITDNLHLTQYNEITISFWVLSSISTTKIAVSMYKDIYTGILLGVNSSNVYFGKNTNPTNYTTASLSSSQLSFIEISYNKSTSKVLLFVNGIKKFETTDYNSNFNVDYIGVGNFCNVPNYSYNQFEGWLFDVTVQNIVWHTEDYDVTNYKPFFDSAKSGYLKPIDELYAMKDLILIPYTVDTTNRTIGDIGYSFTNNTIHMENIFNGNTDNFVKDNWYGIDFNEPLTIKRITFYGNGGNWHLFFRFDDMEIDQNNDSRVVMERISTYKYMYTITFDKNINISKLYLKTTENGSYGYGNVNISGLTIYRDV